MAPLNSLPLELKILWLAILFPLGIWIGWRGLLAADWQDDSIHHMARCVGQILGGAALGPAAMFILFWRGMP